MSDKSAENAVADVTARTPSRWEWLPLLAVPALAAAHLLAASGGSVSRLTLFVGLSLVPGSLYRLSGRRSWNVHRVCFALGLVAFVLENPKLRPDRENFGKILDNWPLAALGFLVSFTQPVWGMLRSRRLLVDSGVRLSAWEAQKLILGGSFFNIFLPGSTGGDGYRIYAVAREHKAKWSTAIASVTLDRFLGLPALIAVVFVGMLLDYRFLAASGVFSDMIEYIAAAAVVCLLLVLYLVFAGKSRRRLERAPADSGGAEGGPAGWLGRAHHMIATSVKRPATLPLALTYGFLSHVSCIVSCLCFGLALGVQGVPPLRYFLIVPMAMAVNAIPGSPGGVGVGELAMAKFLDMASPGFDNEQAGVLIMFLFRLSNIAVGLVGGLVYATGKTDFTEKARRESQRLVLDADPGVAPAAVGDESDSGGAGPWR